MKKERFIIPAAMILAALGIFFSEASAQTEQPTPPQQMVQPAPAAPSVTPAQAAPAEPPSPAASPAPAAQPAPAPQSASPAPTTPPVPVAPEVSSAPTTAPVPTPTPQPAKPAKQVLYGDPCRNEFENFCANTQPITIRMKCLDSHEPEFSKECQERRGEMRDLRAACKTVIDASCRYAPMFPDVLLKCLQEHEMDVVDACKKAYSKAQEPSHYVADACRKDFKKFCKDVPVNGFKIAQCLQEHEVELSEPCRAGVDK